jgi:hypothetical protein
MKKSEIIFATVPNPLERELLYKALWEHYGFWEASFILSPAGDIHPNVAWLAQQKISKNAVYEAIGGFCKGWIAARKLTLSPN